MTAKALFAMHGDTCVIKLKGIIRFTDCPAIDKFIKSTLKTEDHINILVDLTDTELLDSTALGMIAQIAIDSRSKGLKKATLIIDSNDMMMLFKSVCFEKVFTILKPEQIDGKIEFKTIEDDVNNDSTALASQVKDAHQNLMQLSFENRLSFQEIMEALEHQGQAV